MTKKESYVAIKSILAEIGHTEFDEFLDHEVELLSRKRTKSDKPTAKQMENEKLKGRIVELVAEAEEPVTIAGVVKAFDKEYTSQKISAMLRQLEGEGKVKSEVEKKVSYFSLA